MFTQKSRLYTPVITAGLFVMLLIASQAMAQFPGGMRGARGARSDAAREQQRPKPQENPADLLEYRLSQLQDDLKLTREQEQPWQLFYDKITALAADNQRERTRAPTASQMDGLRQVNHAVDVARDQLTAMEDIAAAAKALYERLTPEQKTLADGRLYGIFSTLQSNAGSAPGNEASGFDSRKPMDRR